MSALPLIVITVRGGLVEAVHATRPCWVFVEDWDCPPERPLVIDFTSEPLTPAQVKRVEARLAEEFPATKGGIIP